MIKVINMTVHCAYLHKQAEEDYVAEMCALAPSVYRINVFHTCTCKYKNPPCM